ncbi:MAG TPA: hypothetical protein VFS39_11545 [Nitrospira sp.]|nr:hypothetical protein [Nitrospira sp.]
MRKTSKSSKSRQVLSNHDVKQWAAATLPILKDHLKKVNMVSSAIGLNDHGELR